MPELVIRPVDIVNRALARIGGGTIMDLDEDGDLESAASLIYASEVEAALGLFPWPFARKTFKLDLAEEDPASGYAFSHYVPGGVLGAPHFVRYAKGNPLAVVREFEMEAGTIHSRYRDIWARFTIQCDPDLWLPMFRKAVITGVAGQLAVPVAHDLQLAAALKAEAYGRAEEGGRGGLMGVAIAAAIAGAPPQETAADYDPLTSARWEE